MHLCLRGLVFILASIYLCKRSCFGSSLRLPRFGPCKCLRAGRRICFHSMQKGRWKRLFTNMVQTRHDRPSSKSMLLECHTIHNCQTKKQSKVYEAINEMNGAYTMGCVLVVMCAGYEPSFAGHMQAICRRNISLIQVYWTKPTKLTQCSIVFFFYLLGEPALYKYNVRRRRWQAMNWIEHTVGYAFPIQRQVAPEPKWLNKIVWFTNWWRCWRQANKKATRLWVMNAR